MADAPFLRIANVVKAFDGHRVVDGVSVDIERGEVFALLGSSGCGKTTLLRMLAGFETPTSGSIELEGRDLLRLAPYERPLHMMFQSYALFPHLTVEDNIAFGLRREKMPKDRIAARVDAMLRLVQLEGFAKRKPHQLSGGQQQRVALARSLARQPRLLLLDEPLGALDKKLREETRIELTHILSDVGVTCVLVTHDQDEAMTMASRIAVMSEGRFVQVGTPAEIYETPASRFVADFIGDVNLVDGSVDARDGAHLVIGCGAFACRSDPVRDLAAGTKVTVAIRPERISIGRDEPAPDDRARVRVRGIVRELAYVGSFTLFHLEVAPGIVLKVRCSNSEGDGFGGVRRDEAAWASWSPASVVLLDR